jgi:Tol biopolymer transport system component
MFDRQGNVVTTVGERAVYWHPAFSPDRTRLAVVKIDLASNTENLLVLEIATGNSTQITSHGTPAETERRDQVHWPAWSPDGRQVAYAVLRGGSFGFMRKASNSEGPKSSSTSIPVPSEGMG